MRTKLATAALIGSLGLTGVAGAALLSPAVSYAATGAATAVSDRAASLASTLKGLVSDGTITQAQADKVASTLAAAAPARGDGGPGHGRDGGGGGRVDQAAAATALGLSADALRTQLDAGKTLAQVADAQGVDQATLVKALVTSAKGRLADQVASGRITQAQADTRASTLQAEITEHLDDVCLPGGGGPGHGPRGNDGDADDAPATTASPAPATAGAGSAA